MFGICRVIVGASGSPGSLQALRYAEELARGHHATLMPVRHLTVEQVVHDGRAA